MGTKELVKHCKKGDSKAQEALYRFFAPKLFALSLKYCRNYQEAQDNLQETFITIFDKIGQYENKGSFEGWLKRITINSALQRYRKQKVFGIIDEQQIEHQEGVEVANEELSLDFLLKLIQELPDRYRLVFNLYVLDGYSHKEIAEMLHISVGTSKSNLARARKKLKKRIEENESANSIVNGQ